MHTLPTLSARGSALFLDFDGTLAELASRPDAVHIPPDLTHLLDALHERLGGALALVTGRARIDLQRWLPVQRWPGAFEHGALRVGADGVERLSVTPDLGPVVLAAQAFVAQHPTLLLEVKQTALALHYRAAPELGPACEAALAQAIAEHPGLRLLHGKAVVEVKGAHTGKDRAIAAFLQEPPFRGRGPVFAGDDVTDEAGFAVVQAQGGLGIKVGTGASAAQLRCENPQSLRDWLRQQTLELSP
jgi:trehalose 6-phosphate phosphatase